MDSVVTWTPAFGALALAFAWYKAAFVSGKDAGTDRMKEIAAYIQEGAMAFLRREYKVLAIFAAVVCSGLCWFMDVLMRETLRFCGVMMRERTFRIKAKVAKFRPLQ